jgi:hypothetical protein
VDTVTDVDEGFQRFLAEALALRGGKPFPVLEEFKDAISEGPFSRSGFYLRGPAGTGEIEFVKVKSRTHIRTMTRLRAAYRLIQASGQEKLAA